MHSSQSYSKVMMATFVTTIVVAMIVMLRVAFAFYRTEEWNTPAPIPLFLLFEIPLIVVLIFAVGAEDEKRASIATGTAFGCALFFAILTPILWLGAAFTPPFGNGRVPHLAAFRMALLPAFLVCLFMMLFAFLNLKKIVPFLISAVCGFFYCLFAIYVVSAISVPGSGAAKTKEYESLLRQTSQSVGAPEMGALTACLIREQNLHPENGFPKSLAQIRGSLNCDAAHLAYPTAIKGYWLFYWPIEEEGSRKITDFRLQAVSMDSVPYSILMSDKRGIILEYKWISAQKDQKPISPDAQYLRSVGPGCVGIRLLQNAIRNYMQRHETGVLPQSIQDALTDMDRASFTFDPRTPNDLHYGSSSSDGTRHSDVWLVRYDPPTEQTAGQFTASSECLAYGKDCIRSCFLDGFGFVHATGEPRAATAEDPRSSDCELEWSCRDDVWPLSDMPSEGRREEANDLYLLYTTKWW